MSVADTKRKLKLVILAKIKELKDTLFGSFSDSLTKEDKLRAWAQVTRRAQALGVKVGRHPSYMRDIWWPNNRKLTMAKIENAKHPGASERIARKWNEVDDMIMSIIGKEEPAMECDLLGQENLSDGESSRCDDNLLQLANHTDDIERSDPLLDQREDELHTHVKIEMNDVVKQNTRAVKKIKSKIHRRVKNRKGNMKGKVQLEMELLRVQIYKARLEARQLEMSMSLPHSSYTAIVGESRHVDDNDDSTSDSFS